MALGEAVFAIFINKFAEMGGKLHQILKKLCK